jgi:nucleoid-associated protein YgaU
MTKTKIGLKLANGEFYPVLEDGSVARKRLVVTTVQDGQRSVQIDLYRGEGPNVSSAAYIGSLVIENIPFAPHGEPDIRLDLSLEEDGTLSAYAEDAASGEHQSLQVSLESLSEEQKYEIPDFTFEEEAEGATDSLPEAKADAGAYSGQELASTLDEEKKEAGEPRRGVAKLALFALLALIVALGLAYLIYHFGIQGRGAVVAAPAATPTATPTAAPAAAPAPAKPEPATPAVAPAAVAEKPVAPPPAATAATATAATAATPPAQEVPKKTGVWHKVRWGDTLWDISYAYYQNPWLFAKIARANKIRNPDLIISGSRLWIPAR